MYSSMTTDGKLTCQSADIQGTLKTKNVRVLDDELDFYDGSTFIGRIKYGKNEPVSPNGYQNILTLQANNSIGIRSNNLYVYKSSDWYRGANIEENFSVTAIVNNRNQKGTLFVRIINGIVTSFDFSAAIG